MTHLQDKEKALEAAEMMWSRFIIRFIKIKAIMEYLHLSFY